MIDPGIHVVGVAEVAVAVGQVVVPDGACEEFAGRSVLFVLFLIIIGAALESVGVEAEFGVDEIIYE